MMFLLSQVDSVASVPGCLDTVCGTLGMGMYISDAIVQQPIARWPFVVLYETAGHTSGARLPFTVTSCWAECC
jgi:hypothetical protein